MGIWWSVPKRKSFSRWCGWCVFKFLLRWWCVYGDVWIHSFQLFIGHCTESSAHSAVCKFLRVWWRWWSRVQWPQPRPESDDACANWGATFRYRKKVQKGNDLIIATPKCISFKTSSLWTPRGLNVNLYFSIKHRKNCECCPVSQLIVR